MGNWVDVVLFTETENVGKGINFHEEERNSKKLKTTQMSINNRINKLWYIYIDTRSRYLWKSKWNISVDSWISMSGTQKSDLNQRYKFGHFPHIGGK